MKNIGIGPKKRWSSSTGNHSLIVALAGIFLGLHFYVFYLVQLCGIC